MISTAIEIPKHNRDYGIALPAYVLFVLGLTVTAYIGLNLYHTPDPESTMTFRDTHSRPSPAVFIKFSSTNGGIPDIGDMDPVEVSLLTLQHFQNKGGGVPNRDGSTSPVSSNTVIGSKFGNTSTLSSALHWK